MLLQTLANEFEFLINGQAEHGENFCIYMMVMLSPQATVTVTYRSHCTLKHA